MPYVKKKEFKEIVKLLSIIEGEWGWKEIERNDNTDSIFYFDDYLKIDKEWKERAKELRLKICMKESEKNVKRDNSRFDLLDL